MRDDRQCNEHEDEAERREQEDGLPRPRAPLLPARQVLHETVELGEGLRPVAPLEPLLELRDVEAALLVRAPELVRDGFAVGIAGTKELAHCASPRIA